MQEVLTIDGFLIEIVERSHLSRLLARGQLPLLARQRGRKGAGLQRSFMTRLEHASRTVPSVVCTVAP